MKNLEVDHDAEDEEFQPKLSKGQSSARILLVGELLCGCG